jgi:hypothetical protein
MSVKREVVIHTALKMKDYPGETIIAVGEGPVRGLRRNLR